MSWPLSQDYNEAIQSPAANFSDADLKKGQAVANALGLPIPFSGNFADVYQVRCPDGSRWAVKCFTREVSGLRERYQKISAHLGQAKLPFMVDFSYLEQGIRVIGKWYPVLKMQWVEGLTLNQFVSKNLDKPAMLEALAQIWTRMAMRLRAAEVAHGDLQHGNILLVPGAGPNSLALKLIDYDGMWTPSLANSKSGEVGHGNYQHPQRLREGTYNAEVDRFPLFLVATSLHALKAGGETLWRKYDNADNLLFKEADLLKPPKSPLFYELTKSNDPVVRPMLDHLLRALKGSLETTSLLEEVTPETRPLLVAPPVRLSRLAPAVAPAMPKTVPVAMATAITASALGFDEPVPGLSWTQEKRSRTKSRGRPMKGRIGAAAAAVVVIGLIGGLAAWTMSGPKQPPPSGPSSNPPLPKPPDQDAIVVLEIDQPEAEVSVDGQKQDIDVPGDDKPVTIRVKPGPHQIAVSKDGFNTITQELRLASGQRPPIPVHLVALEQPPPPILARFPILQGGTGTVRLENDALILDDLDHKPGCANVYFGDTTWTDYDFQVDAKRLAGSTQCALWFRCPDTGNAWCYSFGKGGNLVALENLLDARWSGIQKEAGPIENDRWYTLHASVRGAQIRCSLDGNIMFDEVKPEHPLGCVGLHANSSRFAFRNIKVTAPDGKGLLEGLPDLATFNDAGKPLAATPPPPPPPSPPAPPDDPIQVKLDKAKAAFHAAVEKYQQKVHDGLDTAEESARKAGNKNLVDQITAQREAFDNSGDLPNSVPASREFKGDESAARAALDSAYAVAFKAYIKEKMDAKADAIQEERKQFQEGHPTDAFRAGSVWKGKAVHVWTGNTNKEITDFALTVLESDDKTFRARVENRGCTEEVHGIIKRGFIQWLAKDVNVLNGRRPPEADFVGKLSGNVLELKSEWIGYNKAPTVLIVPLRLQRK